MADTCEHFESLKTVTEPKGSVCQECLDMGDTWVHLRSCLGCGNVGCCDASKNRHARRHWEQHNHPLVQTIEPGEHWQYCFADRVIVE